MYPFYYPYYPQQPPGYPQPPSGQQAPTNQSVPSMPPMYFPPGFNPYYYPPPMPPPMPYGYPPPYMVMGGSMPQSNYSYPPQTPAITNTPAAQDQEPPRTPINQMIRPASSVILSNPPPTKRTNTAAFFNSVRDQDLSNIITPPLSPLHDSDDDDEDNQLLPRINPAIRESHPTVIAAPDSRRELNEEIIALDVVQNNPEKLRNMPLPLRKYLMNLVERSTKEYEITYNMDISNDEISKDPEAVFHMLVKPDSDAMVKLRDYIRRVPYTKVYFRIRVGFVGANELDTSGDNVSTFKTFETEPETITLHEIGSMSQKLMNAFNRDFGKIWTTEKSDLKFRKLSYIEMVMMRSTIQSGSNTRNTNEMKLPANIVNRKCVLNLCNYGNDENKCFLYAVAAGLHFTEIKDHRNRAGNYREYVDRMNITNNI